MDIRNHGAKIMIRGRLRAGAVVRLQIIPPDGTPVRVGAVGGGVDRDGGAFFFARSIHHRFIRAAWSPAPMAEWGNRRFAEEPAVADGLSRQSQARHDAAWLTVATSARPRAAYLGPAPCMDLLPVQDQSATWGTRT